MLDTCIRSILLVPPIRQNTETILPADLLITDINATDIWRETGTEVGADLKTLVTNIKNHLVNYLTDLNGDGKYTCEDLVYLLYLGTNHAR